MNELEKAIAKLNKDWKSNVCTMGVEYEEVQRIPFSSPRLNYATYGGVPVGRIVEFFGLNQGGKTTTALDIVGQAQKMFPDKKVLFVDVERTFDSYWANLLGVDIDNLILLSPQDQYAEQVFEATLDLINTGEISVCVLDSLGAMVSKQEYEKSIEDFAMCGISKPLTRFSKEAIMSCARTGTTLIGINQVRDNMNSMYGGVVTTGGKAWSHNCSMRVEFKKSDFVDEKGNTVSQQAENPAGNLVKFVIHKNKTARLDRKVGFYTLNYLEGIAYFNDTIDLAIKQDIIHQGGAWYSIVDENGEVLNKWQGKTAVIAYYKENEAEYKELQNKVEQSLK